MFDTGLGPWWSGTWAPWPHHQVVDSETVDCMRTAALLLSLGLHYPTPMARGLAVDRWLNGRDDAMAGTLLGFLLPQPYKIPLKSIGTLHRGFSTL